MKAKNILLALSAASLAAAPVAAQSAASLSVAPVRAAAEVEDASQLNSAAIALGVLILVAIIAVGVSDDKDTGSPASP